MGLGADHHRRTAQCGISEINRPEDLESAVGAEKFAQEMFPAVKDSRYPNLPEELTFVHAEEILAMYPDLPRKRRETAILQKYPAIFIIGIGWPLKDGYPHEMRAADYDDWITDTSSQTNRDTHGLNGDILVWNHVTQRRHELSSMGIRVNAETLRKQLEMSNLLDKLRFPYHQGIIKNELPLSIGAESGSLAPNAPAAQSAPGRS